MLLLVNHFLQRTHCRRKTDLMPIYAPSWEQTSPPPPLHMGGGGTLTHRENEGAGAHVLPAESGQQLTPAEYGLRIIQHPPTPPPTHSHTLSVSNVHFVWEGGEGGGGQREGRGATVHKSVHKYSSFIHGATVHKLGRKYQP